MSCTPHLTNNPIGHGCTPQMGGIKYLYLMAGANDDNSVMLDQNTCYAARCSAYPRYRDAGLWGFQVLDEGVGVSGEIAYNLIADEFSPGDYDIVCIAVPRQGAVMSSEAQVSRENGSTHYQNSVTIPTVGLTPDAVALLRNLGEGGVAVIGETYDGRLLAFGFEERATINAASVTSGASFSDNPGASVTLMAEEGAPIAADACWLADDREKMAAKDSYLLAMLHLIAVTA